MTFFLTVPAVIALLLISLSAIPVTAVVLVRSCLPLVAAMRELRAVLADTPPTAEPQEDESALAVSVSVRL